MLLRQLFDSESSTYSYLLESDGEAVLIDPVYEKVDRDAALVRELGLKLLYTLETHVHADHVTGGWKLRELLGSKIGISKASGAEGADLYLEDGDELRFGGRALRVRSTPGHTGGCVTYVMRGGEMAFTGDCLLIRGAGRTDFQQGDAARMFESIHEVIFGLPDNCRLYPAHDYNGRTITTVAEERAHNPRAGGEASVDDFVGYMNNLGLAHPKKIDVAVPANLRCGEPDAEIIETPPWGPIQMSFAGIPEIEPEWVATHRDEVTVLDVRREEELTDEELYALEDVVHIPLDELRARVEEVPTDKPVTAICRSGRRSGQATVILRKAGVEKVANVRGGMLRWRELGLASG